MGHFFEQGLPKTSLGRAVHLVDATTIVSPDGQVWRLHVLYDAHQQAIQQLVLSNTSVGKHFRNIQAETEVLYLADRGYYHQKGIEGILEEHA